MAAGHRLRQMFVMGGLALVLVSCHKGGSHAWTVNTTADGPDANPADEICEMTVGGGDCSLRAAIDQSNSRISITDTITIQPGLGTIGLTVGGVDDDANISGDLDIVSDLEIIGNDVAVDADGLDRVFDHHGGALTIRDLTITGGDTSTATLGHGGGVRSRGDDLVVDDTTITRNISGEGGAGIHHESGGALTVTNSLVTLNTNLAVTGNPDTSGGGIRSRDPTGDVLVADTSVTDNQAIFGAGIDVQGWAIGFTLRDSVVADNSAAGGYGGGVMTNGTNTLIERTTISDNSANHWTGFFHSDGGTFQMVDSTVSGNASDGFWGYVGETSGFEILRSTMADNTSAAGVGIHFELYGPGMALPPYSGAIRLSTISGAHTTGLLTVNDMAGAQLDLAGTVVENTSGPACLVGLDGGRSHKAPVSGGHNWASDATCALAEPTDTVGANPGLGGLAGNGGSTTTRLPSASSPLLDTITAGTVGLCDAASPTDQRGQARPYNTDCDIGAVERQAADP